MEERGRDGSSSTTGISTVWKDIWRLRLPNMENNFFWWACHDILPIKQNLCRRKIVENPWYLICETEVETVVHALWECPLARDVWCVGCPKLQKRSSFGKDFIQVVEDIFH
jgi:hypothetical protein